MVKIYLASDDAYSDFYRELRQSLLASGAQVQRDQVEARSIIHIKVDQTDQRVASVSALNRPEQYQVYYRVEYSVDLNGQEAIPLQQVELTANYSYDSTAVLAKQREQRTMQQALARELAGQVMRRLASVNTAASNSH
jgi:LPS-assembly lipoprotein